MIRSFFFLSLSLLSSFLLSFLLNLNSIILAVGETGTGSCLCSASLPAYFSPYRNLPVLCFLKLQALPLCTGCFTIFRAVLCSQTSGLFLSYFPSLSPDIPSLARSSLADHLVLCDSSLCLYFCNTLYYLK